jgi:sulfide:quinone oxidoreductase
MKYVDRYGINLDFGHNLIKIDGTTKTAWFKVTNEGKEPKTITRSFDMIHVCPPQRAPDFIMKSPIANEGGWVDVNPETLQHNNYSNIFALGDVTSTSNAKTVAAARKQAPIVAGNVIAYLAGKDVNPLYDGYGSCPLTVEKGKIILAEFGYGGKIMPTFPWDSTKARRSAWLLKKMILPKVYWGAMLKGREWLTKTTKA